MSFLARSYVLLSATMILFVGIAAYRTPASAAADDTLGMAMMSASVNFNGTLAHGSGVISTQKTGTGSYTIVFERSIASCTCTATVGGNDGATSYLYSYFTTANCPGISKPVDTAEVFTSQYKSVSQTIELTDTDFHLIVFCPK